MSQPKTFLNESGLLKMKCARAKCGHVWVVRTLLPKFCPKCKRPLAETIGATLKDGAKYTHVK